MGPWHGAPNGCSREKNPAVSRDIVLGSIMMLPLHSCTGMTSEQHIQQRIRLDCSRGPVRLWRNNTGRLRDERGQLVTFGLCPGSADLIGYRTVTVTPDMVGQQLAVFAAVEVKSPTGRLTPEQAAFIEHVTAAGGIAGIARSVEDAQAILGGWRSGRASEPHRTVSEPQRCR